MQAGVAVREYGMVVPLGMDGSYMVYERVDRQEARKRVAAAASGDTLTGTATTNMSALQRVVQAWAEEERVRMPASGRGLA